MTTKIKFKKTKLSKLSLVVDEKKELNFDDNFKLALSSDFPEKKKKNFNITFFCYISSKKERFSIELEYKAFFSTDDEITQEFKDSYFPSVNAPAIAFPFMRSFISTVTVNAGLKPMILPTINFQELAKNKE